MSKIEFLEIEMKTVFKILLLSTTSSIQKFSKVSFNCKYTSYKVLYVIMIFNPADEMNFKFKAFIVVIGLYQEYKTPNVLTENITLSLN